MARTRGNSRSGGAGRGPRRAARPNHTHNVRPLGLGGGGSANTGGTRHGGGMCMLGKLVGALILAYLAAAVLAIGGAL